MVAHRTHKNEPHARTSRTLSRIDFERTRTRATAYRTCAHAPSQLIPWQLVYFDKNNNNKQTNKTCYHWLDMQIVKFRDTRNLEIVVGSHEHPILPAFQS